MYKQFVYIIVGLGNPGNKYRDQRHNIGFVALDKLAENFDISVAQKKRNALIGQGVFEGQRGGCRHIHCTISDEFWADRVGLRKKCGSHKRRYARLSRTECCRGGYRYVVGIW